MAYTLDPGTTTKVVSAVTTTTAAPNTNLDDPRSTTGGSGAYPIFTVQPSLLDLDAPYVTSAFRQDAQGRACRRLSDESSDRMKVAAHALLLVRR